MQQVAEKVKLFTLSSSAVPTADLLGWNVSFSFFGIFFARNIYTVVQLSMVR